MDCIWIPFLNRMHPAFLDRRRKQVYFLPEAVFYIFLADMKAAYFDERIFHHSLPCPDSNLRDKLRTLIYYENLIDSGPWPTMSHQPSAVYGHGRLTLVYSVQPKCWLRSSMSIGSWHSWPGPLGKQGSKNLINQGHDENSQLRLFLLKQLNPTGLLRCQMRQRDRWNWTNVRPLVFLLFFQRILSKERSLIGSSERRVEGCNSTKIFQDGTDLRTIYSSLDQM